jgi:hypothetical protein
MSRKVGPVVIVALVVLAGIAVPGTVGGERTAPLGGDAPPSATAVVAPQADDGNATNDTDGTTADVGRNSTGSNSTETVPLGSQISSFMSASAADAESDVESGMFRSKWERSDEGQRSRLVRQRVGVLSARIDELSAEREELLAAENLTSRERARAAWLAAQSAALEQSVDQMDEAADSANVSVDRSALEELRQNARNLTGGEVADIATGLADEDERGERGPPEDAGPPDDAGPSDGDERGPPADAGGGDDDRSDDSGNDGPPGKDDDDDDGEDDDGDENGGGSGEGRGPGNENGPGERSDSRGTGNDEDDSDEDDSDEDDSDEDDDTKNGNGGNDGNRGEGNGNDGDRGEGNGNGGNGNEGNGNEGDDDNPGQGRGP